MPAIYIIGDSTVEDNKPPFRGWGWALPHYVREGVEVRNHALSGCSTRGFREQGLWDPVENGLTAGDLLLIQFGHNDEKDDERHTDPDTTYPENLWRYCEAALARGAQPVLLTPVSRRFVVGGGAMLYTHGEYPRAVRKLAEEKHVPLIDLKRTAGSFISPWERKRRRSCLCAWLPENIRIFRTDMTIKPILTHTERNRSVPWWRQVCGKFPPVYRS